MHQTFTHKYPPRVGVTDSWSRGCPPNAGG